MPQADRLAPESPVLEKRFRLERLLGRGGCGEVHAAFDLLSQHHVALKLLRTDGGSSVDTPLNVTSGDLDLELEESLRAEFRVLRGLSHPGIVRVFDFGRSHGQPFYTMELLEGRDLAAAREQVDPLALLEQAAHALDYLHAHGLVHSDLKPSNVFLVGDRFKLTDFGLVRRTSGPRRQVPYGTLAYMPPERLRADPGPPDPREDLYALGALLFEVLAGRPPYAAETAEATLAAIHAGDLEAELATVPETWARLLRRLLAPDPAQRFSSAWELLQAASSAFARPKPAPEAWEAPFTGRRRELSEIRTAIGEALRGRGSLFYVTGPPGVGKSALLAAAAAQIVASGLPCRRFAAPAAPRPLALAEAMAELYRRWQPGLPEPAAAAAGRLAEWPQALRAAESREAQINAHAHALADLRVVCEAAPHALILDDAHRLDHGSRDLLDFIAFFVRESRIVLLVGGRSGAPAGGDPGSDDEDPILRTLTRARQAGSGVRIVQMRELGRDDVVGLVRRRFGSSHEFELLAERLFDLTQGHPFFVSEALQHLVLTEQLRREKGGWQLAPNTERKLLPRMADTILSEHITAVPAEDRAVIELLALFPSGTEAATLERVLGVGPEARARVVGAALERGVRVGLLHSDGDPARYRFVHELLREASAARCPETTAQRYHRQIADVLADTPAEAYHRLAAGETSEQSRACFLREAQGYEARRAPWEALRYYEAALAADPQAADADDLTLRVAEVRIQVGLAEPAATMLLQRLVSASQPLARARFLHRLGGAYGRLGRNDEALVHLQAASELMAQHAGVDEQRRFTADLVRVLLARGDYVGAVVQCASALASMPAEAPPASRAALLLLQGEAERQSGDYATAEPTCRAALEVLKPLGRTIELAQAYTQIGLNYYYRRVFDQAERFHLAALKVHTELGDLNGMKSAYNNLGMARMRVGKLEEAIRSFEESLDIKRRLGDLPGEGSSLNNLGNLWEKRGHNLRALNCYRRGIRIYRHLNRPRELATLYNNMSEVLFRLGRFRNALRYLERAQQHAAGLGGAYIAQVIALNRGATLIAIHDPQSAAAALNATAQQVRRSRTPGLGVQLHALLCLAHAHAHDVNEAAVQERLALEAMSPELEPDAQLEALLSLAEAADVLGHAPAAEERARQAERLAVAAERPHGRVRAMRLLAAASAERGDWDVAETLLGEAEGLCQSFGFRYELAKCYKCLGKLHWEIGLRSRAEDDFQRCIDLLGDLGLTTELGLTYLELARLAPDQGAGDG